MRSCSFDDDCPHFFTCKKVEDFSFCSAEDFPRHFDDINNKFENNLNNFDQNSEFDNNDFGSTSYNDSLTNVYM